ncbi:MAG: hypothetical protein H3C27_01190 [Opitutaceae bacterium]|nr:hypothetical protein [Opitutaceae bacterium]
MKTLTPKSPFVWPDLREIEGMAKCAFSPSFDELAGRADSIFGIVSGLSDRGVAKIAEWMARNSDLRCAFVLTPYPTGPTRREHLMELLDLVMRSDNRLRVHIAPLRGLAERSTNALCFVAGAGQSSHMAIGPTEDLGLAHPLPSQPNLVFQPDPVLLDGFLNHFNWLWMKSGDLHRDGVTAIPQLVIPSGSSEAAQQWQEYMNSCTPENAHFCQGGDGVDVGEDTGEVEIPKGDDPNQPQPPPETGIPRLGELGQFVARLYQKGRLVSISKLSRVPPLDAPVKPDWFGGISEIKEGGFTYKAAMRVSLFSEADLKELEKFRKALPALLAKFTYALADNMRWMPLQALGMFGAEQVKLIKKGKVIIGRLLAGGIDELIKEKRPKLERDLATVQQRLRIEGPVSQEAIEKSIEALRGRLSKADKADFLPKLSFSTINFDHTSSAESTPWGQAYTFLSSIAEFPRKALADPFFMRGLDIDADVLIQVMNVADDPVCRDLRARGISARCRMELEFLDQVEAADITPRERCELIQKLLLGAELDKLQTQLQTMLRK